MGFPTPQHGGGGFVLDWRGWGAVYGADRVSGLGNRARLGALGGGGAFSGGVVVGGWVLRPVVPLVAAIGCRHGRSPQTRARCMTVDEFLTWDPGDPSGRLWQLIDGEPVPRALGGQDHGALQGEIGGLIGNHLRAHHSSCRLDRHAGDRSPRLRQVPFSHSGPGCDLCATVRRIDAGRSGAADRNSVSQQ